MSNLDKSPEFEQVVTATNSAVLLEPRQVKLTPRSGISISRTLPHRVIKMIGAWCFVDLFGPTNQSQAMKVGAHPHTGLQTVTWLFSGTVEHRDALGSNQLIAPGQLNLMTAGYGISHSELSLDQNSQLHGIQLWVALPETARNKQAYFDHYPDLPNFENDFMAVKIFVGDYAGLTSPARIFSDLVGAEIKLKQALIELQLNPEFEYGILAIDSPIMTDNRELGLASMIYLPKGRTKVNIAGTAGSTLILLGGRPFEEQIIMWWNFVGRTHDEIFEMRRAWEDVADRFGKFEDQINERIPAPPMPSTKLIARN